MGILSLRKFYSFTFTVILQLFSLYPHPGSLHLNLIKQCGDLTCQAHEYCRDYDHTCNPCAVICKEGSNNYSKDTCEAGCQDYIHDELYVRQGESQDIGSSYQSLQKDVLVLKILVAVCLVVIALLLAAFAAFLVYFWRWRYIYDNSSSTDKVKEDDKPKKQGIDLPVIYNNKYGLCNSPQARRRNQEQESPTKSESDSNTSNNNSGGATTMSTMVNSNNSINQKFRKEPSESTLACDTISLSQGPIYTHHV